MSNLNTKPRYIIHPPAKKQNLSIPTHSTASPAGKTGRGTSVLQSVFKSWFLHPPHLAVHAPAKLDASTASPHTRQKTTPKKLPEAT